MLFALLVLAVVYASVFSTRYIGANVNVANIQLVNIDPPLYPLCTGISRYPIIYYNDFESIPLDWVVFNGTLTPRGYIAPQGYWSLTSGYKGVWSTRIPTSMAG
jgi:multisubunit Na+/H+ antiporter MnhE subunit